MAPFAGGSGTSSVAYVQMSWAGLTVVIAAPSLPRRISPDFRNQRTMLLADEQVLWRSDEPLNSTPIASTSTDPAPLTRTLSPRSITSDTSLDESNMLSMVFSFRLPSYSDQIETNTILPPSFEGGSRSQAGEIGVGLTAGCAVGRVAYYISVVGMRSSRLVKDERLLKPFIYRCVNIPPALCNLGLGLMRSCAFLSALQTTTDGGPYGSTAAHPPCARSRRSSPSQASIKTERRRVERRLCGEARSDGRVVRREGLDPHRRAFSFPSSRVFP